MSDKPLVNSTKPSSAMPIAGIYNAAPPAPVDQQPVPLQTDSAGNLLVNVVTGGGANASVGVDGAAAPGSSTQIGSQDGSGKLQAASASNPIPVAVISGGGSNASVGATGAAAPTSATEIGIIDGTGKLQGASATNPVPENVAQWGGTAVQAAQQMPPTAGNLLGTETAPLTRPIGRKQSEVLASSLAGSGGVFTSAWFDSCADGTGAVAIKCYPTQPLASGSIQQTDDTSQSNWFSQPLPVSTVTPFQAVYPLTARYWRVILTNGATVQGAAFQLTQCRLANIPAVSLQGMFPSTSNTASGTAPTGVAVGTGNVIADNSTTTGWACTDGVPRALENAVFVYTGSPSAGVNAVGLRTPNIFKTASATAAGNTAVWTPTTGKKFRLMRFMIQLTEDAKQAVAGNITVTFQDNTTGINFAVDVWVPASSGSNVGDAYHTGWIDFGNGILSAAANNVLNVNLSAALTAGNVRVNVCGTEE